MPIAQAEEAELHYDIIDFVPPWIKNAGTILFHHGLGATSEIWSGWLPGLIDRYRVVRFDLRGHGRSTWPGPGKPLTLQTFCDDVIAVANAAGIQRFHYVGESLGGTTGLALGLRQPERFLTLTASNCAHLGSVIEQVEDFRDYIDRHGMQAWSTRMMAGRFFEDATSPEMRRWYEKTQAAIDPELVIKIREVLVGGDLSADLAGMRVPVLLMNGDSSPFIPVSMMVDMHARLPDSRLQVFPHAKHGLPVSHAGECAKALRGFLEARGF